MDKPQQLLKEAKRLKNAQPADALLALWWRQEAARLEQLVRAKRGKG